MQKILTAGFHKIPYQIKLEYDYEISDTCTLKLIDTDINEEIGYIKYCEEEYEEISSIEKINELIMDYYPMNLQYFYINEEYRLMGFGNLLLSYFVNNIVIDKPCILLKAAYNVCNEKLKELLNEKVLPMFYEKFGFQQYKNSNWYLLNFD